MQKHPSSRQHCNFSFCYTISPRQTMTKLLAGGAPPLTTPDAKLPAPPPLPGGGDRLNIFSWKSLPGECSISQDNYLCLRHRRSLLSKTVVTWAAPRRSTSWRRPLGSRRLLLERRRGSSPLCSGTRRRRAGGAGRRASPTR